LDVARSGLAQIVAYQRWLFSEPKIVWLCFSVAAAAILIAIWGPFEAEPRVRWVGMGLQLAGIGTVAWGVRQTRLLFNRPSIAQQAKAWLARRPKRRDVHLVTGTGGLRMGGSAALGFARAVPGPDTPIEQRVRLLEADVTRLYEQQADAVRRLNAEADARALQIADEGRARETEDAALRSRLDASATGGLTISLVGLVWLMLGTFCTSGSIEIAHRLSAN
jgi:hypothetical protein